jgi:hypothetical protein
MPLLPKLGSRTLKPQQISTSSDAQPRYKNFPKICSTESNVIFVKE